MADRCTSVTRIGLDEYYDEEFGVTRVKIYWPAGSQNIGYIAIRDASMPDDGNYLVDNYESLVGPPHNCPPIVPTATPVPSPTHDPQLPLLGQGRFANPPGGYQSPFDPNSPANVGSFGVHDKGTIDLMPEYLEECIDTSRDSTSHLCDPQDEKGIPIHAPVGGWAVTVDNGSNVVIFWEVESAREYEVENEIITIIVRREVVLIHLDPETITVGSGKTVKKGDLIGNLCHHGNREKCNIPTNSRDDIEFAVNHLALQVRFWNSTGIAYGPHDWEVLGVLAVPNCLYDNWVEDHLWPTPKIPHTPNTFAACPL